MFVSDYPKKSIHLMSSFMFHSHAIDTLVSSLIRFSSVHFLLSCVAKQRKFAAFLFYDFVPVFIEKTSPLNRFCRHAHGEIFRKAHKNFMIISTQDNFNRSIILFFNFTLTSADKIKTNCFGSKQI